MKIALVFSMLLTLTASACGDAPPDAALAHGTVEGVDVDARKLTLDHGDIPGLMKAMTMTFDVAPGIALESLRPGAEVDFRVTEERGVYTVTEIRPSGS
ncbi:MAG: copper-binding protein [Deltaproteobacteria bacterium]|nr:copper-binding protein [Deltaproteobacteria bacterium]MBW2413990.1 copper-binding protein [Deltaproteobacteria bacterium]